MAARSLAQNVSPSGRMRSWPLNTPQRTGIHDLAPAPDGGIWFTAQHSGHLGWFDPKSGRTELMALGRGSSPHGVIQARMARPGSPTAAGRHRSHELATA